MTSYTSHSGFDQRLNVSTDKNMHMPKGYVNQYQVTPSVSTASWGSQFTIQFRQKNLDLTRLILEFQLPAISGLTVSNSGTAAYTSAFFFWSKIDVYIGSVCVDTLYPLSNFLNYQYFADSDEKRSLINTASGIYSSHSTRATKSASSSYWYCPLFTAFNSNNMPLLNGSPDVELRVTLDSLANCYTLTSGETASGTVAGAITAVNLITKQSKLPTNAINHVTSLLRRAPLHYPFLETRQQSFTVSSGVTSTTLVLTGLVGLVPFLIFTIRSTTTSGSGAWTWNTTLTQYELLSGSSENLVGGQPVKDIVGRLMMPSSWVNTTFPSESGAGVYLYSFTNHPKEVRDSGSQLVGYSMRGNESLKLTFSSSLGANVQVDVYAPTHAALELTPNLVKKISLTSD